MAHGKLCIQLASPSRAVFAGCSFSLHSLCSTPGPLYLLFPLQVFPLQESPEDWLVLSSQSLAHTSSELSSQKHILLLHLNSLPQTPCSFLFSLPDLFIISTACKCGGWTGSLCLSLPDSRCSVAPSTYQEQMTSE